MTSRLDAHQVWRVLVDATDVRPGCERIDRPDWVQLRTPGSRIPSHNKVQRARLVPELVEAKVREVVEDHKRRRAGWVWVVDEGSEPADAISEAIERIAGVKGEVADGMVRKVPTEGAPPSPEGVRIVPLDESLVETLGEVGAKAWGRPPSFRDSVIDWAWRALRGEHHYEMHHWIAYLNDEAVGSCTLSVLNGVGYLQGAAVFEEARGRGIYTATVWTRLAALRERGIEDVVIWAHRPTSAPIAKRMGFKEVTSARFHQAPQPESSE